MNDFRDNKDVDFNESEEFSDWKRPCSNVILANLFLILTKIL